MSNLILQFAAFLFVSTFMVCGGSRPMSDIELPDMEPSTVTVTGDQTAIFAGGCFWGVEAVFEHVRGVKDVVSGYSGGTRNTANYAEVSGGATEHAETVMITYDPKVVTYQKLLFIFFTVAHDPTQLNRQGPDHGKQYRSAIFYKDDEQMQAARAFVEAIERSGALDRPVVTQIVPFTEFFPAEDDHQDFARLNPDHPYIMVNDAPKVAELKRRFPEVFVEKK